MGLYGIRWDNPGWHVSPSPVCVAVNGDASWRQRTCPRVLVQSIWVEDDQCLMLVAHCWI